MTRIATGRDLISKTVREQHKDRIWVGGHFEVGGVGLSAVQVSDVIPDGSIVRHIKIGCRSGDDQYSVNGWALLRIVNSANTSVAEMLVAEPLIQLVGGLAVPAWVATMNNVVEDYPMERMLNGSHLRLGVLFNSNELGGVVFMVAVQYSVP